MFAEWLQESKGTAMTFILQTSLTNALLATLLALVAALVSRFGRRPALAHALWLLVLLKLITPPFFFVPLRVPESWTAAPAPAAPSALPTQSSPASSEPNDLAFAFPSSGDWDEPTDPVPAGPECLVTRQPEAALPPPTETASLVPTITWQIPDWDLDTWAFAAGWCWLAGAGLALAVAACRIGAFHRLLRYGRPAPVEVQERARRLAKRLELGHCPEVWLVPGPVSPLVWAVGGRARLVLPALLLGRFGPEKVDTLLAHELAHIRRHDHWVRWLELLAGSLYWWFPVAWWARRQIQQLEEQCCDAWVVWALPDAVRSYARALLETVDFLADARPALPPVASGLGYVRHLKRRLVMILNGPSTHRLSWPACLLALALGALILPASLQRLAADTTADPPAVQQQLVAVTPDDPADDEEADDRSDRAGRSDLRDLDRRLRALERRMDRLMQTIERSQSEKGPAGQAGQKRMDAGAEARERARAKMEDAKARAKAAKDRAKEAAKGPDVQFVNPEALKNLDKQIREMVERTVNPERMKEMERRIEKMVEKNIDPKRMEDLGRQIEQAVNKAIDPKRMEELGRQIEEAVNKSLDLEKRERSKEGERTRDRQSSRSSIRRPGTESAGARGRDTEELERRLDRLEQRMDQLLQSLENSRKPATR
jgi:beta-lactamase regulating signal transducer with metallopeptidase domain